MTRSNRSGRPKKPRVSSQEVAVDDKGRTTLTDGATIVGEGAALEQVDRVLESDVCQLEGVEAGSLDWHISLREADIVLGSAAGFVSIDVDLLADSRHPFEEEHAPLEWNILMPEEALDW